MTVDQGNENTLIKGSSYQIWCPYGIPKQFDSLLTLYDPCMSFDPIKHYTSVKGSSYKIWLPLGIQEKFDPWLTPDDPCVTFDPRIAINFGQGFFLPYVVTIGHF